MKSYKLIVPLSLSFILTLLFQNCGAMKSQDQWSGSQSSSILENNDSRTPSSTPAVTQPQSTPPSNVTFAEAKGFKSGDDLTENSVPTDKLYILNQIRDYIADDDSNYNAIAMTVDGYGALIYTRPDNTGDSTIISQEEANRKALESCQFTSNNRPCALFAEGNRIVIDWDKFLENMHKPIDLNLTQLETGNIPLISDNIRNNQILNYMNGAGNKALALDLYGGGGYQFGEATEADARRKALANCQNISANRFCFIYAVGNKVVLTEEAMNDFFEQNIKE